MLEKILHPNSVFSVPCQKTNVLFQLAEEVPVITSFDYTTNTFFTVNTFSIYREMYTGYPHRRLILKVGIFGRRLFGQITPVQQ